MSLLFAAFLTVQQRPRGIPVSPLGTGPFVLDTAEQHKIRVLMALVNYAAIGDELPRPTRRDR